jgi:hypothetical protein
LPVQKEEVNYGGHVDDQRAQFYFFYNSIKPHRIILMGDLEMQARERANEPKSKIQKGWKVVGICKRGWYMLRRSLNI